MKKMIAMLMLAGAAWERLTAGKTRPGERDKVRADLEGAIANAEVRLAEIKRELRAPIVRCAGGMQ